MFRDALELGDFLLRRGHFGHPRRAASHSRQSARGGSPHLAAPFANFGGVYFLSRASSTGRQSVAPEWLRNHPLPEMQETSGSAMSACETMLERSAIHLRPRPSEDAPLIAMVVEGLAARTVSEEAWISSAGPTRGSRAPKEAASAIRLLSLRILGHGISNGRADHPVVVVKGPLLARSQLRPRHRDLRSTSRGPGRVRNAGEEREKLLGGLNEWATLSVLAASGSVSVFDPAIAEDPPLPPRRFTIGSVAARAVGDFVGRRNEQRRWPRELVDEVRAGMVLHGIGGVGKTTLAAEIVGKCSSENRPGPAPY